jgi:general stress protein 26
MAPPPTTPLRWSDIVPLLSGHATIATTRPDGSPHVAVVAPAVVDDSIWVFTRRSSRKAQNLLADPRLAMMWRPAAEVYLQGRAVEVDDLDVKRRLWDGPGLAFDPTGFFGSVDDPDFVLFRIEPERAVVVGAAGRQVWTA